MTKAKYIIPEDTEAHIRQLTRSTPYRPMEESRWVMLIDGIRPSRAYGGLPQPSREACRSNLRETVSAALWVRFLDRRQKETGQRFGDTPVEIDYRNAVYKDIRKASLALVKKWEKTGVVQYEQQFTLV